MAQRRLWWSSEVGNFWIPLFLVGIMQASGAPRQGTWVTLADDGRLLYQRDDLGNRIVDFSGCGYRAGKEGIPLVPTRVVVNPADGDDRVRIQAAIDQVSVMTPDANGFRGAVLLTAGEYQIATSLRITTSGVVLRGVGESETDGTRLKSTDTTGSVANPTVLLTIQGSGSASTSGASTLTITSPYVPVGSFSFQLDSVSGLSVGDAILIYRPSPANWIAALGMDQLLNDGVNDYRWKSGDRDLYWQRTVQRIEGLRIFLDSPIPTALDATYGGGTVKKYTFSGRIEKCGVEDIRGISSYNPSDIYDEAHAWIFIQIGAAQNCWVRGVTSRYFAYACVSLIKAAKWVSVLSCRSLDPISTIDGGRRYAFVLNDSELCLVRDCSTQNDRHHFVTHSDTSGPHAFVSGTCSNPQSEAGPHHRWASGILWDRISVVGDTLAIRNRGNSGTGHGWAGANCVAWNCQADSFDVENPPTARNWLVGGVGTILSANSAAVPANPDFGTYDANGANVFPISLWGNQRQDALAKPTLQVRDYLVGDFDRIAASGSTGDAASVDSAWLSTVNNFSGNNIGTPDDVRPGKWIPWTHSFTLDSGDTVLSATLWMGLRSTDAGWTNDLLYLESTSQSVTLNSLGAALNGTSTTVVRLDLKNFLSNLADGKLNLSLSGDTALDWSVLELRVAPSSSGVTTTLAPEADGHVQGGVNSASNFGTSVTLMTKASSGDYLRKAYLRWNLQGVSTQVADARVRLVASSASISTIENSLAVAGNDWEEATLNYNNQPASQSPFVSWFVQAGQTVELDVTREVQEAMANDGKLTLQISSPRDVGSNGTASYSSKEASVSANLPQLVLTTLSVPNTSPIVASPGNQTVLAGMASGPIVFGVSDGETVPTSLTITASSSNPSLVPDDTSHLTLGGVGAIRNLIVTPNSGVGGVATITLTGSDGVLSSSASFLLTVTGNLSPRQSWWNQNFGSAEPGVGSSSLTADPDLDGMSNLLEYSLGGNPVVPDAASHLPVLTQEAGGVRFSYRPSAADISYVIEVNSDLADPLGWRASTIIPSTNLGTVSILEPNDPAILQKFYRLKASTQ